MHDKNDPSIYGAWEPIKYRFSHLPVHMALLHTGNVLAFGGSGNDPKHLDNFHESEFLNPTQSNKKSSSMIIIIMITPEFILFRMKVFMEIFFVPDMFFCQMEVC